MIWQFGYDCTRNVVRSIMRANNVILSVLRQPIARTRHILGSIRCAPAHRAPPKETSSIITVAVCILKTTLTTSRHCQRQAYHPLCSRFGKELKDKAALPRHGRAASMNTDMSGHGHNASSFSMIKRRVSGSLENTAKRRSRSKTEVFFILKAG